MTTPEKIFLEGKKKKTTVIDSPGKASHNDQGGLYVEPLVKGITT